MAKRKRKGEDAQVDMTPMIDVVFQLIIFFIVTIKMDEAKAKIILEDSKYGPEIESLDPMTLVVEVNRRGWISIRGAQLSKAKLQGIITDRFKRHGSFPVLVRADYRAKHRDVRSVMDICSGVGLWRINFAAVREHKETPGRHMAPNNAPW